MIASHLASLMAPFAQLANKHALADIYKCVQIDKDGVAGCSQYGIMDANIRLGIPERIWLDAIIFHSVLKSLPDKEEVQFELKGGALEWECGMSTGKLALMGAQKIPSIDWAETPLPQSEPWPPTDAFIDALDLGGLSCGSVGMASAGVYGIVLDNRDDFSVLSSDDVTISICKAGAKVAAFPEQITFSPDAIAMLRTVLNGDGKEAALSISSNALYCVNKAFRLFLRPIPPVKHDLRAHAANFSAADTVASIPRERLAAFIKRAAALSEDKGRTHVTLAAASGALSLSFVEGASSSDEYYLVDKLDIPALPEIKLDAARIARVLAHSEEIVLDHIDRRVLLLRGKTPPFSYMICGRSE